MVDRRNLCRTTLMLDPLILLVPLLATGSGDPVAALLRKFPRPSDWKFVCYRGNGKMEVHRELDEGFGFGELIEEQSNRARCFAALSMTVVEKS